MSMVNIFLISVYWAELMNNSIRAKTFVYQYRKQFIAVAIVLFGLNIILSFLVVIFVYAYPSLTLFNDMVTLLCIIHLLLVVGMFIYSFITTFEFKGRIEKVKNLNKKHKIKRTANFLILSNCFMILFVIGILMVIFNLTLIVQAEWIFYGLIYIGQVFCDISICFVFSTNLKKKTALSTSQKFSTV